MQLLGSINLFQFTQIAIILEFAILIFMGAYLILWHKISFSSKEKQEKRRADLLHLIEEHVHSKKPLEALVKKKSDLEDLTHCLLILDSKERTQDWDELRTSILTTHLLPWARIYCESHTWTERVQAARIFTLIPQRQDEADLLHLLKDRIPVIRYLSAQALSSIASEQGIDRILLLMNECQRFLRIPYIHALQRGKTATLEALKRKLAVETDAKTRLSCIEVLSKHMDEPLFLLVKKDLSSANLNLRLAAIKALGHFQNDLSIRELLNLLNDSQWEIRALSARSLGYLKAYQAMDKLETLLKDSIWWVRMNAALALKRLGNQGKERLMSQKKEEDLFAFEIASYVLALKD